jgi:hypothetical protein
LSSINDRPLLDGFDDLVDTTVVIASTLSVPIVAGLLLVCAVDLAFGLVLLFDLRGAGVKYVRWYRAHWARMGPIEALQSPGGTRAVAAAGGLLNVAVAVGLGIFVIHTAA